MLDLYQWYIVFQTHLDRNTTKYSSQYFRREFLDNDVIKVKAKSADECINGSATLIMIHYAVY